MSAELRLTVWNVAWRRRDTREGTQLLRTIERQQPQVLCLSEAHIGFQPGGGHLITSEPDYGYPLKQGRRKVMLWSASPWQQVDTVGSFELPPGRFVTGVTETPIGPLRFAAICVPWRAAHVSTGMRNKSPWEEHGRYLDSLKKVLESYPADLPMIVLGDFNQTVPRTRAPPEMYSKLELALEGRWRFLTASVRCDGLSAIDHIAATEHLSATGLRTHSRIGDGGAELSDHFGISVTLSRV